MELLLQLGGQETSEENPLALAMLPYAALFPAEPQPLLAYAPLSVVDSTLSKLRNVMLEACIHSMQALVVKVRNQIPQP